MGLTCHLAPASPRLIEALAVRPDGLPWALRDADGDVAALDRERRSEPGLDAFLSAAGILSGVWCHGPEVDLEKTWAGIHFLLTGAMGDPVDEPPRDPLAAAIFGWTVAAGDPDEFPPPLRLSRPDQVAATWSALETISPEGFRARFLAANLSGVYPGRWKGPEDLSYLAPRYVELRGVYQEAAQRGAGMVIRFAS